MLVQLSIQVVSRERWTVNRDGQDLGDAVREDGGRGEGRAHVSAIEGRLPRRKFEHTTQS